MNIIEEIERFMEERLYSKAEIAREIGVTKAAVSLWTLRKSIPCSENKRKLIEFLKKHNWNGINK